MRSRFLPVVLGAGLLGLAAVTPRQTQAFQGPCSAAPAVPTYYAPSRVAYASPQAYYVTSAYYRPYNYQAPSRPTYALAQSATTVNVGIYDNSFQPATITVLRGTTIRWANYGRHKHTVTSSTGAFDSGDLAHDGTYSVTFTQPGRYDFYCRLHPREMRGTILVQ
jgi:plastocyanin